jgi:hypothetical protein
MTEIIQEGFPHFEKSLKQTTSPARAFSAIKKTYNEDLGRVKPDKVRFIEGDVSMLKHELEALKRERELDGKRHQIERNEKIKLEQ